MSNLPCQLFIALIFWYYIRYTRYTLSVQPPIFTFPTLPFWYLRCESLLYIQVFEADIHCLNHSNFASLDKGEDKFTGFMLDANRQGISAVITQTSRLWYRYGSTLGPSYIFYMFPKQKGPFQWTYTISNTMHTPSGGRSWSSLPPDGALQDMKACPVHS